MATSNSASLPNGTRTTIHSQSSITSTQTTTSPGPQVAPVLRLRGAPVDYSVAETRRIQWDENVINNEGMGKKKSKVCCIYHAPREFGESSDDSSSDESNSSDESSSDNDQCEGNSSNPMRSECSAHAHKKSAHDDRGKGKKGRNSPNAYEKMPKIKSRGGGKEKTQDPKQHNV